LGRLWGESAAGSKPGADAGGIIVEGSASGSRGAAVPPAIGNVGRPAIEFGAALGAFVLGNCAADGSGGIVAVCNPGAGLFGGGACDATAGRLSVNHDGGPGRAGDALFGLAGSSPDAVTTAYACALPRRGLS